MGHINLQQISPLPEYPKPWDVTPSIGQWACISLSGHIFNADVYDLPTDNQ